MSQEQAIEMWAKVELMGHAQTAGRISRPSDWGGLLRVDVPEGDSYCTEFYGMAAVYSIKLCSEQIARAFATPLHEELSYNAPIITREQHEAKMRVAEMHNRQLQSRLQEMERRLIAVKALPSPDDNQDGFDFPDEE